MPDAGSRQAREAGPDEPWVMIRSAIAQKRPMLGVALEKIVDFAVQGEKAVLSYPEDQTLLRKQCEESRELIESEIAKNIGKRLVFVLAPATASPKTVQVKKPALDLGARKQMLDDPIIQKAVDLFDGRPGFENDNGN